MSTVPRWRLYRSAFFLCFSPFHGRILSDPAQLQVVGEMSPQQPAQLKREALLRPEQF